MANFTPADRLQEVQKTLENPHITKKIRPSEEVRIFILVGVAGFEPAMLPRKTLVALGFSGFITFFHYIFTRPWTYQRPC